jgi:hypothetical protein
MKIRQYVRKSLLFAIGSSYEKIWREFNSSLGKEDVNFLQSVILISMLFDEQAVETSVTAFPRWSGMGFSSAPSIPKMLAATSLF